MTAEVIDGRARRHLVDRPDPELSDRIFLPEAHGVELQDLSRTFQDLARGLDLAVQVLQPGRAASSSASVGTHATATPSQTLGDWQAAVRTCLGQPVRSILFRTGRHTQATETIAFF